MMSSSFTRVPRTVVQVIAATRGYAMAWPGEPGGVVGVSAVVVATVAVAVVPDIQRNFAESHGLSVGGVDGNPAG